MRGEQAPASLPAHVRATMSASPPVGPRAAPAPVLAEVVPGLWVCGEDALPTALGHGPGSVGVTHVVSIGYPPPDALPRTGSGGEDVEVLRVELEDEDDGDLLSQIPAITAFVSDGLRMGQSDNGHAAEGEAAAGGGSARGAPRGGGGVLVHCHAGVSRSAAVVTAHVMRTRRLDPDEALAVVRAAHPAADPNPGFRTQLALWHSMDCKLNMADEAYRLYSVAKLAREREYNGYINATAVQPDPGAETNGDASFDPSLPFSGATASAPVGPQHGGGVEAGALVRCRKCRRLLARGKHALPHEPGIGLDAFSWHQRTKHGRREGVGPPAAGAAGGDRGGGGGPPCQNMFLEPMAWMDGIEQGAVEGKVCCPKCDVKVGAFNWSGCQCSCGAWVTPAFYVQLAKVDVMQVGAPSAANAAGGAGEASGEGRAAPVAGGGVRMPRRLNVPARPPVVRPSARREVREQE